MKDKFISLNIDFVGFCASVICAIHCALTPVLVALLPLAGLQFLTNPIIEFSLIAMSAFIASFSLFRGYTRFHKDPLPLVIIGYGFLLIIFGRFAALDWQELLFSSLGALSIAVAHMVNWFRLKRHF